MAWLLVLLTAILLAIILVGRQIDARLRALILQTALLRRDMAAGLGVNIDHPNGYLDGGHLDRFVDDLRERRSREREQRRKENEY